MNTNLHSLKCSTTANMALGKEMVYTDDRPTFLSLSLSVALQPIMNIKKIQKNETINILTGNISLLFVYFRFERSGRCSPFFSSLSIAFILSLSLHFHSVFRHLFWFLPPSKSVVLHQIASGWIYWERNGYRFYRYPILYIFCNGWKIDDEREDVFRVYVYVCTGSVYYPISRA